jgi:hypothetical protein
MFGSKPKHIGSGLRTPPSAKLAKTGTKVKESSFEVHKPKRFDWLFEIYDDLMSRITSVFMIAEK